MEEINTQTNKRRNKNMNDINEMNVRKEEQMRSFKRK